MVVYTDTRGSKIGSVDKNVPLAPGDVLVQDPAGNYFITNQANAAALQKWLTDKAAGNNSPCPATAKSSVTPVTPGTPLLPGNVWVYDQYGNQYQTTPDLAAGLQKYVNSRERPMQAGYEYVTIGGQRIAARSDYVRAWGDPSNPLYREARQYYSGLLSVHGLSQRTGEDASPTGNQQDTVTGQWSRNPVNAPTQYDNAGRPGSSEWWAREIANREAAAKANTEATPVSARSEYYDRYIAPPKQLDPETVQLTGWTRTGLAEKLHNDYGVELTQPQEDFLNFSYNEARRSASGFFDVNRVVSQEPKRSTGGSGGGWLGALFAAPTAMYEFGGTIQRGISDVGEAGYGFASMFPKPIAVYGNEVVGFGTAVASTVPFLLSVPYGAQWAVSNPAGVPGKAWEMGTGMLGDIWSREQKSPGSAVGTVVGMWAGGEYIVSPVYGKVKAYSPVKADMFTRVPTGDGTKANYYSTLSVQNPLSLIPKPKFVGGFAFGEDIAGVRAFRGSPVSVMKGTNVAVKDLFNVRGTTGTPPTPAQLRLLDPFFREVTKGTPHEPFVAAAFDLKQLLQASEGTLTYKNAQPAGTFHQTGIDAAVQTEVHQILAEGGAVRLGSGATTDWLGRRFMRDTSRSDIDVDVPKANFDATVERLKIAYAKNSKPVEFEGGGKFKFPGSAKDEHIIGVSFSETYPDVRYYTEYTRKGTRIGQQTPEYAIESKSSRLFEKDAFMLFKKGETVVELNTKKIATDMSDIFANTRGIAKTAYDQRYFRLGRAYEGVSNNVRRYAESIGATEKLVQIEGDILKGTYRGRGAGSIFGVDLGGIEYPTGRAVKFRPKEPVPAFSMGSALGIGSMLRERYPEGTRAQASGFRFPYPTFVAAKKNTAFVENYPTARTARTGTRGMVYPMGAAVAPFRITPQARSSIAYPSGSVTSEYPKGMIGRYPSGVPEITQKISTTRIPSIKIPFGGTGRGGHSRGGFAPVIPSRLIIMPKEDERRGRTIRKLKKKQPYREIIPLRRMFLPGKMPDFERRFTILPGTNRVVGGMVRPEFEGRFLKPTQEYRATRGKGWIEAQPVHIPKKEQPPIKLPDMGRRVPLHTIFAGTGGRINTRMMNVPPVNLGPVAGKRRKGRKGGLRLL